MLCVIPVLLGSFVGIALTFGAIQAVNVFADGIVGRHEAAFAYHPLVFAVTIPVSVLFTRYRSRRVRPLYRERSAQLGRLNGFSEEMTEGLRTIQVYHREEVFRKRFQERNQAACEANYRADCFASMTGQESIT